MDFSFLNPPSTQEEQSAMADALRRQQEAAAADAQSRQEQAGQVALLSGVRSLQPYGQAALQGVAHDRQRQVDLARMVAAAKEQAIDNQRQAARDAEIERHNLYTEKNPAPLMVMGVPQGAPAGANPEANLVNPRTGQVQPLGLTQPAKGGGGAGIAGDKLKEAVLGKLGEALNPDRARSGLLGKEQEMVQAAERIETLQNSPGPMTPQRIEEITMLTAKLAAGGAQPTEAQVKGMFPHTFSGDVANWYQYATSHPADAGVQEFMKMASQQSEREKKTARAQMSRAMLRALIQHPVAFEKYPEEAHAMAEAAGLKGLYDPKTLRALREIDPVAEASGGDRQAALVARIAALKASGVTDPAAIKAQLVKEGLHGGP